jgi:hypothetical protein
MLRLYFLLVGEVRIVINCNVLTTTASPRAVKISLILYAHVCLGLHLVPIPSRMLPQAQNPYSQNDTRYLYAFVRCQPMVLPR